MTLRMRDVRQHISNMGFDKGLVHCMELLIEENIGLKQNMVALAELQQQVIASLDKFNTIGTSIADQLDELKRKGQQYEQVSSERTDGEAP